MIADIFEDSFGNEYTTWFANGFDTGSHIKAITECIDPVIANITDVNANTDRHFGVLFVFDLHLYGTFDRVDAAVEYTQCTIAKVLNDFASIFFMEYLQDAAMPGTEQEGAVLIDVHQVSITHDIREDDGCETAFEFTLHEG